MLLYYGYPFYYRFDPTYILIIIGVIISLIAQARLSSQFSKYKRIHSMSNMTGRMVAERILQANGINDVSIEKISGEMTDHFDPRNKVLRLSSNTYNGTSIASIGIAAHECGHAIQHNVGYAPINIRSAIVPVANIGSKLSWILILVGLLFTGESSQLWLNAGIICFSAVVVFHLVTLPVEYNASNRALENIEDLRMLDSQELKGAKKVLNAAALTYVAGAATAILQLLRIILLFGGRNDRD